MAKMSNRQEGLRLMRKLAEELMRKPEFKGYKLPGSVKKAPAVNPNARTKRAPWWKRAGLS